MTIRNHINSVQALFEMPQLQTAPEDFGFNDPQHNRGEYERLADTDYKPIEETKDHLLAVTAEDGKYEIFLLDYRERALVYYVEFVPFSIPGIGSCATQVVLWRRSGSGVPNVTTRIFNDFLGKRFAGIVSDKVQTHDGRRFWIDRMAEAARAGKQVGLLHGTKVTTIFEPAKQSYPEWLAANNAWGEGEGFRDWRYFIKS